MSAKTSPAAVSARLRRAGFGIVSGDRRREGIRVHRGVMGEVHVEVDHNMPGSENRAAGALAEELQGWEGYTVRRVGNHFYVSKSAPVAPVERITPDPGKLNAWYLLGGLGARLDGKGLDVAAWNAAVADAEADYAETAHPDHGRR